MTKPLEHREPVLIAGHRLAVHQAGTRLEAVHGLDDERIAGTPVMPVAGEEPDADRVPARHEAVAVVLDLVDPVWAARRALGGKGQARLDEAAPRRRGRYAQHPGKVGADTGGVDHPNANGGAQRPRRSGIVDAAPLRHQRGRASLAGTRALMRAAASAIRAARLRAHKTQ